MLSRAVWINERDAIFSTLWNLFFDEREAGVDNLQVRTMMVRSVSLLFSFAVLALVVSSGPAFGADLSDDERRLVANLREPGYVALMRHALAPGTGDPDGFSLDDCTTQRNLSPEGRLQARKIGEKFRQAGVTEAEVYTSQWCRCRETASLLGLGDPRDLPVLNSFFQEYGRKDTQTDALRDWLAVQNPAKPLILVTHQVNITALSGVYPGSGEVLVMQRSINGAFRLAGSFRTE